MTRPAVAHTGLYSTKWLGVLLLPPGWDASPCSNHPQYFIKASWQFAGTRSYSKVERGKMKVWCFPQEHNTINRPSLYLDLVPSSLTRRPLSLLLQVRKPQSHLKARRMWSFGNKNHMYLTCWGRRGVLDVGDVDPLHGRPKFLRPKTSFASPKYELKVASLTTFDLS